MPGKIVQRSIAMTEEMRDRLQQLVSKHSREYTESDLIREAIRRYLDEQEDIIGSRRHFQKSFQDRIDRLEFALTFHFNVLLHLTAASASLVLQALTKQKVPAQQLLQNAIIAARRDDRNQHIRQGELIERWQDHGLGKNYRTILNNCADLSSKHVLAWTWVISPRAV